MAVGLTRTNLNKGTLKYFWKFHLITQLPEMIKYSHPMVGRVNYFLKSAKLETVISKGLFLLVLQVASNTQSVFIRRLTALMTANLIFIRSKAL